MFDMILHFDQVKETDRDRAGGKGHTLARLRQAGFPVPSGFIVTTNAYRAFLTTNGLDTLTTDVLADGDPVAASAHIQAAFEEAEMPPAVVTAICDAYLALGKSEEVAVRSSALAEDDEAASFAGQYETVLSVVGCNALLAAVRRCWASLWSERALAYRHSLSHIPILPHLHATMAVVVQRMVPAAQAGVAFTLDPVSGCRDMVVIEAVAGQGEALMGGQAAPHHYVVRRGTNPRHVGDNLLAGEHLAAVVVLAEAVEAWAGAPQDVEWALDKEGRLYLLQARPITATGSDRVVRWTRDNVGEVVPEPVTPLSWSVLEPLINGAFAGVLRRLRIEEACADLFGCFYGRVYFNQTLYQKVMGRFYLSRVGWRGLPRLTRAALRVFLLLYCLPREGARWIACVHATPAPRLDRRVEALLGEVEAWRRLETALMEVHLSVTVMGTLLCQVLEKVVGEGAAAALLARPSGVRSAGTGVALTCIARRVAADETLRRQVLATPPDQWPEQLGETEAGRALLARLQDFLEEYGHSAPQEFELAAPRWRDDPLPVLAALQIQVRAVKEGKIDNVKPNQRGLRDALSYLNPWTLLVREARRFAALRENLKDAFILAHGHLRNLYLALGETMTRAGSLDESAAVFFLAHEEIVDWFAGRLPPGETQARAAARQSEWEQTRRRPAPFALDLQPDGRLLPRESGSPSQNRAIEVLHGVPAAPGAFVGRARVVGTLAEAVALVSGEVLVAPAVTPGWAPLLRAAGALVTEIGGILSHGAIIAREYGLPAVFNITDATRCIRTGQLVHVDGAQGIVRLLEKVT